MTEARRVVGVVLAAGAGTRFGGGKLVAPLHGRPLAAHAATIALASGVGCLVIVLGADADTVEAALVADGTLPAAATGDGSKARGEAARGASVVAVRNPAWATGIASSVACGLRAAAPAAPDAEAALILLGDQPAVRPGTIARLLAAGVDADRPFAVARASADQAPNPVLVHRSAWPLADALRGDRGFGPLLADRPHLVTEVEPLGPNPDVDTRADLDALAAAAPDGRSDGSGPFGVAEGGPPAGASDRPTGPARAARRAEAVWAARIEANDDQSGRLRETPEAADFYGPVASIFAADPRRSGDPGLDALLRLALPGDRWLDIGAGAGRYALPLALRVREVVALDASPSMLAALRDGMTRHGIANVVTVEGRWPADPVTAREVRSDVALVAHVGYDIARIGAFLDAMEAAADRLCVAVLSERVPSWPAARFWPRVYGEARIELPALGPFLEILAERGARPRVERIPHEPRAFRDRDELHRWIRHQLFLADGSARDRKARELVDAWAVDTSEGVLLEHHEPVAHGVVWWEPR